MKISDLAALVTVRNHINVVMNDKGVSSKDDFRPLNDIRIKLDKKFIVVLRETNIDDLFTDQIIAARPDVFELGLSAIDNLSSALSEIESEIEKKVEIDLSSSDGVCEDADTTPDHPDDEKAALYRVQAKYSQREDEMELEEKVGRNLTDKEKSKIHDHYFPEPEKNDTEEAELALIAERVKAQKELLKKQGRSNKRVPKKEDDTSQK